MKTLRQRHEPLRVEAVLEPLEIFQILLERLDDMRRHAGVAPAGLHGIEGGGKSERQFMQMALKFPIAAEAQPAHDSNDRCRIGLQALGHRAHAEQHVFARMLENWADNLLALDAKLLDALAKMHRVRWGRSNLAFHYARGLPKSYAVSTFARETPQSPGARGFNLLNFVSVPEPRKLRASCQGELRVISWWRRP